MSKTAAATYTATASNGMSIDLSHSDVWNNGGGAPSRFVVVAQAKAGEAPQLAGWTGGNAQSLARDIDRLVNHYGWRFAEACEVVKG